MNKDKDKIKKNNLWEVKDCPVPIIIDESIPDDEIHLIDAVGRRHVIKNLQCNQDNLKDTTNTY